MSFASIQLGRHSSFSANGILFCSNQLLFGLTYFSLISLRPYSTISLIRTQPFSLPITWTHNLNHIYWPFLDISPILFANLILSFRSTTLSTCVTTHIDSSIIISGTSNFFPYASFAAHFFALLVVSLHVHLSRDLHAHLSVKRTLQVLSSSYCKHSALN